MSTILDALRKIQREERRQQEQGPEAGSEAAPEVSTSAETDVGEESPLSRLVEKASPAGEQRRAREAAWVEGARSAEALAERLREADRAVYGEIDESKWEGGGEPAPTGGESVPASAGPQAEHPEERAHAEELRLPVDEDRQEPAAAEPASSWTHAEEPAELPTFEPSGGRPPAVAGNRRTLLLGGVAVLLVALLVYGRWPGGEVAKVALAPKVSTPSPPAAANSAAGKPGAAVQGASKRPADAKHPKAGQHRAGQAGRPKAAARASEPAAAPQAPAATAAAKPATPPSAPAAPAPRPAARVEVAGANSPPSATPATPGPAPPAARAVQAPATGATARAGGDAASATAPTPAIAPAKPEPPFPGSAMAKAETRPAGGAASPTAAASARPKAAEADTGGKQGEAEAPPQAPSPAAAEQPQAEPKPTVSLTPPAGAPEVHVVFVQWARTPQRRMVSLRNPSGTLLVLREGDFADPGQGLVVSSIGREWVDFTWKNSTYRVFLNEH